MSSKSRYEIAKDSHPARVSGRWAKEKLEAVGRYLQTVTTAMKHSNWKRGCYFLDLLAGGGRCILKGDGGEFDGSPIVALKCAPAFSSVVLVEQNARLVLALRARTAAYQSPAPTIIEGDCNHTSTINAIRAAVPRDALTIAFIDNLGWDVSLSTISRIAADRRMDLIVTFQISALTRNVQQALKDPAIGTQWDAHLGNGWRKAVADVEAKRTQAPNVGAALADYYADRLSKLGYKYRQQLNDTMKNTRNATLYRVMCFSKHQLGGKLFGAVSKSVDAPTLNFEG